jgi:hypothetical protein
MDFLVPILEDIMTTRKPDTKAQEAPEKHDAEDAEVETVPPEEEVKKGDDGETDYNRAATV